MTNFRFCSWNRREFRYQVCVRVCVCVYVCVCVCCVCACMCVCSMYLWPHPLMFTLVSLEPGSWKCVNLRGLETVSVFELLLRDTSTSKGDT